MTSKTWPAPVKAYLEFQKLNCELLGLSIDSYYSHVAWVRNIKEEFGVDIPFPIIGFTPLSQTVELRVLLRGFKLAPAS